MSDHDPARMGQMEARRLMRQQMSREERRAERLRLLNSGPPSPCISVCQMDPLTGYCVGCTRTIDEIRDWIISTPDERHAILKKIAERRAAK
ncbi:hypothetical protein A8950_0028 [Dongia mobilis]|uniref:Fe-S protein YdhL (DUF1289 family) n=1 Tax=Dongia mobilis TaxID=578943 RepID=A0A4R6WZ64_9PROT|nr:DUF1289 domain-containing protein [Dongia mobilis]TDQ86337.1 hypothetical protein A8950_0028 [Dongia mobilis]